MAKKHLIIVHGRAIKPAENVIRDLATKAITNGLGRAKRPDAVAAFKNVKISLGYYGDISNAILAENSKTEKAKLTATDPDHGNKPCFPAEELHAAFKLTDARSKNFDKAAYGKILSEASDSRYIDELADTFSLFGALLTGGLFNKLAINVATKDLGAYLTSHSVGSAVRSRLSNTLEKALAAQEDVCLLTHSMGCMVAYDVMWKFAHQSEYEKFRSKQAPVSLWLTIGNPLGEPGVRQNLLDGRYPDEDRYPRGQIRDWANFYAVDDFISHAENMAPAYRGMKDGKGLPKITDTEIYNCWIYEDIRHRTVTSNPHDLYGYLMNQKVAARLADWLT